MKFHKTGVCIIYFFFNLANSHFIPKKTLSARSMSERTAALFSFLFSATSVQITGEQLIPKHVHIRPMRISLILMRALIL